MSDPLRTHVYDERLGWHDHLHAEIGRVAPMNETLTVTEGQIAAADHHVRCVPIATDEQWCFYKHIEYANDLVRALNVLVVTAVSRLPDYEAAVDALERMTTATERLDPTEKVLALDQAHAVLRRLRGCTRNAADDLSEAQTLLDSLDLETT